MRLELLHTLLEHEEQIWCCSWHPSGKHFATCGVDGMIVWSLQDHDGSWLPNKVENTHTSDLFFFPKMFVV